MTKVNKQMDIQEVLVLFLCRDVNNGIDGSIHSLSSPQLLDLTLLAFLVVTVK